MLKRIACIKGVGTFTDCDSNGVEHRKTSLVFGQNSYGKSTLSELFRSLESQDTSEVVSRRSIPGSGEQLAVFKFYDGQKETALVMADGAWKAAIPGGGLVQVFDSNFVDRNLFVGKKAERENKEALSRFVLGAQGVDLANALAEYKKTLRSTNANLKGLREQLSNVGDIDVFVSMKVAESPEEINARHQSLVMELGEISRRRGAADQIRRRPGFGPVSGFPDRAALFAGVNDLLESSADSAHEAARARIVAHIKDHVADGSGAVEWLRQGVANLKSDKCPLCEQHLAGAKDLLDNYRLYFDDELRKHVQKILAEVREADAVLRAPWDFHLRHTVERQLAAIEAYHELEGKKEYEEARETVVKDAEVMFQLLDAHLKLDVRIVEFLLDRLREKRASPYEAKQSVNLELYLNSHKELSAAISTFNLASVVLNQVLSNFKASVDPIKLEADLKEHTKKVASVLMLKRRLEAHTTCEMYVAASGEVKRLTTTIQTSETELNRQQSEYLAKFFKVIDQCFGELGSRRFEIGVGSTLNMVGHQPVLTLTVKFNGVQVDPSQLGLVFSESDRRALALSIFWAKVMSMDADVRARTIIVLDDPVTSFDDGRISSAIKFMRLQALGLRQLIVLTHYHAFAKRWLDAEPVGGDLSLLMIDRDEKSSSMVSGDPAFFLHSDHHKTYQRISDFVARKSKASIRHDLRVFLENEIRDRYRLQIAQLKLDGLDLKGVVEGLALNKVIEQAVADEAHLYREDLNNPHHDPAARSDEDWATFGHGVLNFVYERL